MKYQPTKYQPKHRFNKLTLIKHLGKGEWKVRCDCGTVCIYKIGRMSSNHTKSCGCTTYATKVKTCKDRATHGMSGQSIYLTWQDMKKRCFDPNNKRYKDWGGRGITVCQEWCDSFETFYKDMGDKPANKTLGRIDNNGDYCKDNCRWETDEQQRNNRRNTIRITYKGKTQSLAQWARELQLPYDRLKARWRLGYRDPETIFFKPTKFN